MTSRATSHDLYLRGSQELALETAEHDRNAVDLFLRASQADPTYALPQVGLTRAYSRPSPHEAGARWREAIAAGERAIALDPGLTEAYAALWRAYYPRQWLTKMRPIAERRVELAPNDYDALDQLGWILWFTGQPERALPFLKRSIAASPSSPWSRFYLGNASLALELFADAEIAYGKAVALKNLSSAQIGLICTLLAQDKIEEAAVRNAEFRASHDSDRYFVKAADCELLLGNREEARALAEQGAAASPEARYYPRGVLASTILAYVQWDDDRPAALRRLKQSEEIDRQRLADGDESAMTRYNLAAVDAVRGDSAAACGWLEAALEAGWRGARLATRDPLFTGIRGLAAFDTILEEARARIAASRRATILDG